MDEELVGAGNTGDTLPAGSEARVNFSIVVPSPVQTRAPQGATDEGAVNRVYLLLFENKNGLRTYRYKISAENLSSVSNTQKTFSANLPVGVYDIAVLANAAEIINGSGIAFGDTKEQVLGALVETNTGKWSNISIPMWGRMDNQTIGEESDFTGKNAIPMIRMMAKIEIDIAPDAAGANNGNFKLTDIRLYNYSARGALVPDPDAWPDDNKALRPTEPAGGYAAMRYPDKEPLVFDAWSFYAYETPAGGKGAAMASNTCLIVGGSYRGGDVTYYRVDFVDESAPDAFLPLLRNHHYLITIIDVVGDGYPTPEIAFETTRSNMQTSVAGWNNSGMEEVAVDDPNSLEVSQSAFTFTNNAQTAQTANNKLTICTSAAGGWEIEKITDTAGQAASWLTTSEMSYNSPNTPKDIYLFATENKTGAERTAYISIRAGKLSFRVTVIQKEVFDIRVTDANGNDISELTFPFAGGTKTFIVSWTPASASLSVASATVGKDGSGTKVGFSGSGWPSSNTSLTGGSKTYTVKANAYTGSDLVMHRATEIDFTIISGGAAVTRSVFLRQADFSLSFVKPSSYLLDGGEKTLGIRSNLRWTVVDVIDNGNIIADKSKLIGKTGGMNTSAEGEKLAFRVANRLGDPNVSSTSATIVIRDSHENIHNAEIKARSVYEVGNLLVWPVDMPAGSTWYQFADVPDGTYSNDVPPSGPRNASVDPLSCAALDASDKNLWRLPTRNELETIFADFRNNGGYDNHGMVNVDCTGTGIQYITHGYWTAEGYFSDSKSMAYFGAYSTDKNKLASGAAPKTSDDTYEASKTYYLHARCVRSN